MLDKNSLENLINAAKENNVSFISDEIYHGIQYEHNPTTAIEITNDCYVINSFSKYFSIYSVLPLINIAKPFLP